MDTRAIYHLAYDSGRLLSVSNNNNNNMKCVLVGNGHSIPFTQTGHSQIHSTHRPLHLHNILVSPNIIKNLIYVTCFTPDNKVSNEFDPNGFSMKDLETHQVLLRCHIILMESTPWSP